MLWMLVMMVVLAIYAIRAFLTKPKIENYDHQLILSDSQLQNTFSHSVAQLKWHQFEQIQEARDAFRMFRMSRFTILPKRVVNDQLNAEQAEILKQFLTTAIDRPKSTAPVSLYTDMIESESQFPVYRFRYHQEDMDRAVRSKFALANTTGESPDSNAGSGASRKLWWFWAMVAIMICVAIYRVGVQTPLPIQGSLSGGLAGELDRDQVTFLSNGILLAVGWFLPLILVLVVIKLARLVVNRQASFPDEEIAVRLTNSGWIAGNEDGALHFDWRDVDAIFDSQHFFGFKTINRLMNVIPKRIFADTNDARSFLSQAVEMQKRSQYEKAHSDVPVATIVETGNPYQSPSG